VQYSKLRSSEKIEAAPKAFGGVPFCFDAKLPFYAVLVTGCCVFASGLSAQAIPDAGQIQREAERAGQEQAAVPETPLEIPDGVETTTEEPQLTVRIAAVRFQGNTLLRDAELQATVADSIGKDLSYRGLQNLTRMVRDAYMEAGYLARVVLPEQNLKGGVLLIQVEEMLFGEVSASGLDEVRVPSALITGTGSLGQTQGEALRYDALQRAASLLNNIPGMHSELVLERGSIPLTMDVRIPVAETDSLEGMLSLDNFGSESTGVLRFLGKGTWANPLRRGDAFTGIVLISEGNHYMGGDYSIPLGFDGWRIGVHGSALDYELVGNFEYLEASGNSVVAGLHATYPIVLRSGESLLLSVRTEARSYYNEVAGIETSDKLLSVGEAGLSWLKRDTWLGGGRNFASAKIRFGDVDLSGNADNERQDALDAGTAESFAKLEWSLSRWQSLGNGFSAQVSASGQFGMDNLDSSETLSLGGPSAVRAYPALEASMDDAVTASLEFSKAFNSNVQAALFYDVGNGSLYATARRGNDSTLLQGAGASLRLYSEAGHSAQISVARRIGDNPNADPVTGNDQDGTLREWRLWASCSLAF
jgi:hemolysin activation/secretion protein